MLLKIKKKSDIPVYLQIKEQLKNYIIDEELPEGTMLPDIKTIAQTAKVSLRTAYLGIDELIKEGICFKRPKKGTFVGKFSKTNQEQVICGIYSTSQAFENQYLQMTMYRAINIQTAVYQYHPLIINHLPENTIEFYQAQKNMTMAGIIVFDWNDFDKGLELANRFPELRFVFLNFQTDKLEFAPPNAFSVFNDEFGGGYQMAEYLVGKGHRSFAVISIDLEDQNYRRRIQGFAKALHDNNISIPDTSFISLASKEETHQEFGYRQAEKLLSNISPPDAIFTVNDLIAEGVIAFLGKSGLNKKIEVTGYDYLQPTVSTEKRFSTMAIDFEKMAKKAIDIVSLPYQEFPRTIRIMPQLIPIDFRIEIER